MNNIDLSIIIVNYRSWCVLQQCLDSFQQFPPKLKHEIIVVDNDSQDGEFDDFAENNPQIKLIKNSGNNGFSNGCNLGADNAHGEFLLFLNPDTVLTISPAIDSMFEFAKKNSNIGITSCRKINPKGRPETEIAFFNPWLLIGWIRGLYKFINKTKIQKKFPTGDNIWQPDWIAGSVMLIQSKLFNQAGKWSQKNFWMYGEDLDLCKKVRVQNKDIALLRNVEIKHAHGGSSRKIPTTTAITKSEVVTSSHVYIQLHTKGFNRILLHLNILLNTIFSQILKTSLSVLVFWKPIFKTNILVLLATLNYYFNALVRLSWISKRLTK